MTESNDHIDGNEPTQRKPFGLWFLQAYFLVKSGTFAYVAVALFGNSGSLPIALLTTLFAVLYLVGIASAQGRLRYGRAICIALMLVTLAMELLRPWIAGGPGFADRFKFQMGNAGEHLGAQLAHVYGTALQLVLLLYLLFSRHVREFFKRARG